jgi:hypothetical protein
MKLPTLIAPLGRQTLQLVAPKSSILSTDAAVRPLGICNLNNATCNNDIRAYMLTRTFGGCCEEGGLSWWDSAARECRICPAREEVD